MTDIVGRGSRIASVRRLALGGWHVNHALDVVDAGGATHRVVLRRWARPGWEVDDPDYTAKREMRVLELLRRTAVPAPAVLAADPDGERCGVPALLLTRLPGQPPTPADRRDEAFCRQLAEALAQVHDVRVDAEFDCYRLYYDRARAGPARWMPDTSVWRQATAYVRQPPPMPTSPALIHRDYHPENTLWSRGRLTGVIDWTQASRGPKALDIGHMRWNLVLDHGQAVADRFLACYRTATRSALDDQPYWDLVALFDLLLAGDEGSGDLDSDDLQRLEDYAATALARRT